MMTHPIVRPTLRTSDQTTNAVRRLVAETSAELGGERVTQERLISAMVRLADNHRSELVELLR